jgi:hypothetical protein
MIEILWKDNVHYRRPNDHPDVAEIEKLIEEQKRLYGNSLYSIREVATTD